LMGCKAPDAKSDPRVRDTRAALVVAAPTECVHVSGPSPPTQEDADDRDTRIALLEQSETKLISTNDQLRGRVHSLEAQSNTMQTQVSTLHEQVDTMQREMRVLKEDRRQRELWERQISAKLGFDAPPVPSIEVCSSKIDTLRRSIGVAEKNKQLKRRLADVDEEIGMLNPGDHTERIRRLKICMQIKTGRAPISWHDLQHRRSMHGSGSEAQHAATVQPVTDNGLAKRLRTALHPDKNPDSVSQRQADAIRVALKL